MTPEELAARHPGLFHIARPEALPSIRRHGLLSATAICDRLGLQGAEREAVIGVRRSETVTLEGEGERFLVNDNKPLLMAPLARALDDGLTPDDWLAILNGRVFFWVDEAAASNLAGAYSDEERVLLVFDTLSLARAHADRMALSPINGGNTRRAAARRGRTTYAPLARYDYAAWRRLRRERGAVRGLDTVREVTVDYAVPDAAQHLVEVRPMTERWITEHRTVG